MRIVIVGRKHDRHVLCWGNFLLLGMAISLIMASGMLVGHWFLSGEWNRYVGLAGAIWGGLFMGFGVIRGFQQPLDQLQDIS